MARFHWALARVRSGNKRTGFGVLSAGKPSASDPAPSFQGGI